jgi:hypothetical protein
MRKTAVEAQINASRKSGPTIAGLEAIKKPKRRNRDPKEANEMPCYFDRTAKSLIRSI